jgi:glucose dehydrogenase
MCIRPACGRVNTAHMTHRIVVGAVALACAVAAAVTLTASTASPQSVAAAQSAARTGACCIATEQDYSSLAQITPADVHSLAGAWLDHLEGGSTSADQESTPVAVGGRLYVQTSQGDVFAVNGATGQVIWKYRSGLAGTERGVAVAGTWSR